MVDKPEVAARLRAYLEAEFPNPVIALTDTTDLLGDWFVDSLGLVQVVMFIESEFSVTVSRADINGQNFQSISTLSDFIATRLADPCRGP